MSTPSQTWRNLPIGADGFIALVIASGMAALLYATFHQSSRNIAEFICYLCIAVLASRLRLNLPGITGALSVNFLFILIGIVDLSYSETILLGAISMLAQCLHPDRPNALQLTFNVCGGTVSTALAYFVYHLPLTAQIIESRPLALCLSASIYFIANAGSMATVISFTEGKPLRQVLGDCYLSLIHI